jgi:hypothetical protein
MELLYTVKQRAGDLLLHVYSTVCNVSVNVPQNCKEEQGGRAPIVVPHKEYTHTHPLDRNGLLGLKIHITCMGPGTNHGPRSGLVGYVKAMWGRVQGPDLAGRNGCDRCDRAQQQIIQLIYAKQIRPPPPLTIQLSV